MMEFAPYIVTQFFKLTGCKGPILLKNYFEVLWQVRGWNIRLP